MIAEPKGLNAYDTARQRYEVVLIRETDTEYICRSKYDGGEFVLPKFAWTLTT